MGLTSKAVQAVLVALAVGLALSLLWGFKLQGEARVLRAENNRMAGDLVALVADAEERARTDIKQSTARAKQAQAVRATRDELKKEEADAQEPRPVASESQLDRLRRLTDAANAGIRASRELP